MSKERTIRRIVVAVDPSAPSLAALEAAARLALEHDAELLAVYVEDIDLLRLAGFPFAQELCRSTSLARSLRGEDIERALRAEATRVRRALEKALEGRPLRWNFRVTRGRVDTELLAATEDADILFVGRASTSARRPARLGATARVLLAQSRTMVAVFPPAAARAAAIAVVYDGSEGCDRALAAAARLASRRRRSLIVLIAPSGAAGGDTLRARAAEALAGAELDVSYRVVAAPSLGRLRAAIDDLDCALAVLPASAALFDRRTIAAVVEDLDCAALVVH